jgi:hypothetical protein
MDSSFSLSCTESIASTSSLCQPSETPGNSPALTRTPDVRIYPLISWGNPDGGPHPFTIDFFNGPRVNRYTEYTKKYGRKDPEEKQLGRPRELVLVRREPVLSKTELVLVRREPVLSETELVLPGILPVYTFIYQVEKFGKTVQKGF